MNSLGKGQGLPQAVHSQFVSVCLSVHGVLNYEQSFLKEKLEAKADLSCC